MFANGYNQTCGFSLAFVPEADAQHEFTLATYPVQFSCKFFPTKHAKDAQGRVAPEALRTEQQICGGTGHY